jgi:hypothetical protein
MEPTLPVHRLFHPKPTEKGVILVTLCIELIFVFFSIYFLFSLCNFYMLKSKSNFLLRALVSAYEDECSYVASGPDLNKCLAKIEADFLLAADPYVDTINVYVRVFEYDEISATTQCIANLPSAIPPDISNFGLLSPPALSTTKRREGEIYIATRGSSSAGGGQLFSIPAVLVAAL